MDSSVLKNSLNKFPHYHSVVAGWTCQLRLLLTFCLCLTFWLLFLSLGVSVLILCFVRSFSSSSSTLSYKKTLCSAYTKDLNKTHKSRQTQICSKASLYVYLKLLTRWQLMLCMYNIYLLLYSIHTHAQLYSQTHTQQATPGISDVGETLTE